MGQVVKYKAEHQIPTSSFSQLMERKGGGLCWSREEAATVFNLLIEDSDTSSLPKKIY
jgi:hypothetical protein